MTGVAGSVLPPGRSSGDGPGVADQADRSAASAANRGFELSYGELDRRANRLARHLLRHGAGPERLVGLFVERSLETVLGILGILKSGAAYLPLDPLYPPERLRFMLEDAGVSILVTQDRLAASLPPLDAAVIRLDTDRAAIDRESDGALASGAAPESLAYVIYTSGSTGRPKGSLVTHANVSRLFRCHRGVVRLRTR